MFYLFYLLLFVSSPYLHSFPTRRSSDLYGRFSGVINSSSVCVKKQSLVELGGFPENITRGEDIYMWLRLALAGSIAVSPEPLVRSEEHTSELQSRENIVCRLLLEKKNDI